MIQIKPAQQFDESKARWAFVIFASGKGMAHTWYVTFEVQKRGLLLKRRSPRMTRTFETVTEAKNFAQTKLDEGLTAFAGTLNPHLPRQGDLLSPREKQLLRRMAAQKTDNEIAIQLGGTAEKIAQQRIRLLSKLQISSKTEIAEAVERLIWPMSVKGTQSRNTRGQHITSAPPLDADMA